MCHLVVGDGKGGAGTAVQNFAAQFVLNRQPALLTEGPVKMNWLIDLGQTIFRNNDDTHITRPEEVDQVANNTIDCVEVLPNIRVFRPQPLKAVIQMRKIY